MRLVDRETELCIRDPTLKTPAGKRLDFVIQKWMEYISIMYPNAISDIEMQRYSEMYHASQTKNVEMLFSIIIDTLPDNDDKKCSKNVRKLFSVLELFRGAVTELGDIFLPPGFEKKFTGIGYRCLPRSMFMQYISRGLMTVSKGFVLTLYEKGVHKSDPKFFYSMLCGLPLYTAVKIMLSDPQKPPPPLYLVEFFLSKQYKTLAPSTKDFSSDSPFYPLETFVLSLKECTEQLNVYKTMNDSPDTQAMREFMMDIDVMTHITEMVNMEYFLPLLELDAQ